MRRVAVFGSTGSIGRSALDVAARWPDRLQIVALSAHSNVAEALRQAEQFRPRWLILTSREAVERPPREAVPPGVELLTGADALAEIAASSAIDTLVSGIVGIAGLPSTWAAVDRGKRVALANKETLVAAGPLIIRRAQETGAEILPVDSEHSAVFQALQAGRPSELERVILTASGGPFRDCTKEQLREVTIRQALDHPTWKMGEKITIDSATMMNKALEIIEARWLFGLDPDQIEVLIHPQSIVHSMVEFRDGSVICQMSPPDMRLPIQYALSYPERWSSPAAPWRRTLPFALDFRPPDLDRFPALELGFRVARDGGTAGAVLNAANEAAVGRFLHGELAFHHIPAACQAILSQHSFEEQPSLERIFALDQWARKEMTLWTVP